MSCVIARTGILHGLLERVQKRNERRLFIGIHCFLGVIGVLGVFRR
jgi:hypothetical protein